MQRAAVLDHLVADAVFPLLNQSDALLMVEEANVGQETRWEQHVSDKVGHFVFEIFAASFPSYKLGWKVLEQGVTPFYLVFDSLLLFF